MNAAIQIFGKFLPTLALVTFSQAAFSQGIQTTITKLDHETWTVNYTVNEPIKRMAFRRNPDDSRTKRWTPQDENFQIVVNDLQEFVVRKDGSKFADVAFYLTPTHKRFSKDYAPFSPFKDAGTLIHSGRFFACKAKCVDSLNEWPIRLIVPEGEHVILNGETVDSDVSWVGSNSGQKIYVGNQQPALVNDFITVIDESLPIEIKDSLQSDIPKLTAYFKSKLGKLPSGITPELYVSYSPTKGPSVRAGVLPNQIFVHLDKDDIDELANNENFLNGLLWTFAHEIAHYFQRADSLSIRQNESWIHEGHAEFLAYDALMSLYPFADRFRETKVDQFRSKCADALKLTSLKSAAENGVFNAYYTCGFFIHQSISNSASDKLKRQASPYTSWMKFRAQSTANIRTSEESFLQVVKDDRGNDLAEKISHFINLKHNKPAEALQQLIEER